MTSNVLNFHIHHEPYHRHHLLSRSPDRLLSRVSSAPDGARLSTATLYYSALLRLRILARAIDHLNIHLRTNSPLLLVLVTSCVAHTLHYRVKSCLFSCFTTALGKAAFPWRSTPCFTYSGQHGDAEHWRFLLGTTRPFVTRDRHHYYFPLLTTSCRRTKTQAARHHY